MNYWLPSVSCYTNGDARKGQRTSRGDGAGMCELRNTTILITSKSLDLSWFTAHPTFVLVSITPFSLHKLDNSWRSIINALLILTNYPLLIEWLYTGSKTVKRKFTPCFRSCVKPTASCRLHKVNPTFLYNESKPLIVSYFQINRESNTLQGLNPNQTLR